MNGMQVPLRVIVFFYARVACGDCTWIWEMSIFAVEIFNGFVLVLNKTIPVFTYLLNLGIIVLD
jgi:hypothetical protein